MDLKELIRLSEGSGIAAFARAQVQLYRHDTTLQDYFLPLHFNFGNPCDPNAPPQSISNQIFSVLQTGGYKILHRPARRKLRVDVLYCPTPYYARQTENNFIVRTVMALAQTDATILCLMPSRFPLHAELQSRLESEGRTRQVTFLDPLAASNPVAARLLARVGRARGRSAFSEVKQVLQPLALSPSQESLSSFEHAAHFAEAWSSLEDFVEFDAVVARCHWLTLCSPVCRTALERGKPVITFQQGVIDQTLDVPVSASHYVAFGRSSADFLARMNRSFFRAVGKVEPPVKFVPGGSLFDAMLELPNQFENCTLLVLDAPDPRSFYGHDIQRRGVHQLVQRILQSRVPLRKVVIRPHPSLTNSELDPLLANTELEPWKQLAREYPDTCELSHSVWTLEDDMRRSSIAVGNHSGALTVAAASGLPTVFLEIDSFATQDLNCFRSGQTFPRDDAFREIKRMLTDPQAYAEARAVALRNARDYYENGTNLRLDAAFFERMLRAKPVSHLSSSEKGP